LVFGVRLVLYALRDDEHLARRQPDRTIAKIDPQSALEDDERLIRVLVIVPNEVALQPHELELVVVHFGDDLRLPLLVKQPELLAEIDRFVGHVPSLSIKTESGRLPSGRVRLAMKPLAMAAASCRSWRKRRAPRSRRPPPRTGSPSAR